MEDVDIGAICRRHKVNGNDAAVNARLVGTAVPYAGSDTLGGLVLSSSIHFDKGPRGVSGANEVRDSGVAAQIFKNSEACHRN